MRITMKPLLLCSTIALMQPLTNHAFMMNPTSLSRNRSSMHHQAMLDGTEIKVNGESTTSMTEKIESIRQEAIAQYEQAMEYYMFELGNDIVFLSNHNEVSNYITTRFDTIIFDCDGVLYRGGNTPIPESSEALKYLLGDKQNKQVLFLTNNAEYSREELRTKLANILDCDELKKEQMITSSYSTAKYLESKLGNDGGNVVVVGSNGLCNEIEKFGFEVKSLTNILNDENDTHEMDRDALSSYSFDSIENFDNSSNNNIDAVVVGLDTSFTYRKLCIIAALIRRHPASLFIATNEDAFDVVDGIDENDKRNLPGNGSIVKSIEMASQKDAINVGKPSKVLVDLLQKEYQFDYERTLMVGDRLDTDVKFGKDGGMKSALVLTGCTTADKLMEVGVGTDEEPLPHIMIPHMGMMYANGSSE